MQEFALKQAISFHIIIIYFLFAIALINLIALIFMRNLDKYFAQINRLSWVFTPLFLGLLFIAFLSGISIWAMIKFEWSAKIALMIVANFAFVVEILRIKKLRIARTNLALRKSYVRFAQIANALYVAIILYFLVF